jgi:hypothetical protein
MKYFDQWKEYSNITVNSIGHFEWGEHIYTEKEFQDIFILGLEVKSLKKKWQRKRNDVRKVMVKCERDLDNFTKEENREITALIEGIPEYFRIAD